MPLKDQEKRKEFARKYAKRYMAKLSKENREKILEYKRNWWRQNAPKKNPNYKPQVTYYDFETHRELAINSGIQNEREWYECFKRGFMPDGIYGSPDKSFRSDYKSFNRRK